MWSAGRYERRRRLPTGELEPKRGSRISSSARALRGEIEDAAEEEHGASLVVADHEEEGVIDAHLGALGCGATAMITAVAAAASVPSSSTATKAWSTTRNSSRPLTPVNSDLYTMTLPDGEEVEVTTHPAIQHRPDVDEGLAVWVDFRHAADPNDWNVREPDTDLYLRDLDAGSGEVRITDLDGRVWRPYIVGHRVFFIWDDLLDQRAVFMIDLVDAGIIDPDR